MVLYFRDRDRTLAARTIVTCESRPDPERMAHGMAHARPIRSPCAMAHGPSPMSHSALPRTSSLPVSLA
eukprot:1588008-Prymnesium_polylepis.1